MGLRWQAALLDPGEPGGLALVHCHQHFLCDRQGVLFPRDWLKRLALPLLSEQGLGHFDGERVFLLVLERQCEVPGAGWLGLRQLMQEDDDHERYRMLAFAAQIATWASQHRFCGSCGAPMRQRPGERAMHCEACGTHHYPRISPSMIVLVSRGDEILLARSPRFVPGVYSALAGFVEPGESVEQCVAREVREEVGLSIQPPHYIASQGWPFPHSLMLGFHAEYAAGDIVPQPEEIEDAAWFHVERLPVLPSRRSIARYLIELYVARRLGKEEPAPPI
ncbi:NAD(+) diphosphatase [Stutzerimonas kirkiae]|uniref:NAD-capped RNA hydrolase NudC n=1 Tax=Stutzerimonas kirkiae TaxID=2211392 RepID=A0A4Q9R643_9GAMM|nr:NAD(+) diphosphatase [Stutzerimonas kirkiae]TBU96023.1 NAD(+) diphosphatase [Stutzerimonas kirkiae]TBV03146.1 NAD(+) diphosphatase [Stutzerimonas kirkiae]TBV09771.1 NAD(+) diphosphatase [Stutzerimonas kirkiae]TBV13499.1 NAD(+) diphosphatase [Stutzerimonas kirkiae]